MRRPPKWLALLLSVVLAVSLLPAAALAAETDAEAEAEVETETKTEAETETETETETEDTFITRKEFVMKVYQHPAFGLSERTSSSAAEFTDLDDCTDEEKNAFGVLRDAGIFMGNAAGSANPSDLLLRYEAVLFIQRVGGNDSSEEPAALPYADIHEDSPFGLYGAIGSLYADGILTDEDMDEDGNFRPFDNVTVAEVDAWLEAFIETGGAIPDAAGIDPEALAAELKELGLFQGNGELPDGSTDFDLDRAPTRTEAVIMLIRVLGQEETALAGSWEYTFEDVPAWADAYIGYAYQNGLAAGNSNTEFGSTGTATSAMYLTFVLRALGYSSDPDGDFVWDDPYTLATTVGILPASVELEQFQRGDLVVVSAAALGAKLKGSEQTLAEKLIEDGIFTQEQYSAATLIHSVFAG